MERLEIDTVEYAVADYVKDSIFHDLKAFDSLFRNDRIPMYKRTVPEAGSKLKSSTPVPGMLYR
jgi:hypothetical protein